MSAGDGQAGGAAEVKPGFAFNLDAGHVKAALLCAAKNDIRFYLNSVLIEVRAGRGYIVSTNGQVLFCAMFDSEAAADASVIVPRVLLEGRQSTPTVGVSFDGERVTARSDCDRSSLAVSTTKYPDWRKAISATPSGEVAQYAPRNAALIGQVAKACDVLYPAIHHNGTEGGLVMLGENACMVIMPMRVPHARIINFWGLPEGLSAAEADCKQTEVQP